MARLVAEGQMLLAAPGTGTAQVVASAETTLVADLRGRDATKCLDSLVVSGTLRPGGICLALDRTALADPLQVRGDASPQSTTGVPA